MQLLADRFVTLSSGQTVDLATGGEVCMRVWPDGGSAEGVRWAERCETLHRLHHVSIARLVDYGAVGPAGRFEAWGCGPTWRGSPSAAEAVVAAASRFLAAEGLTRGVLGRGNVRTFLHVPVVWLDDDAGYPEDVPSKNAAGLSIAECGIEIQARGATAALIEMIELLADPTPRVVAVWGPSGSGLSTMVADVARSARLSGFVPVSVVCFGRRGGAIEPDHADALEKALRGRSLVLLDDEPSSGRTSGGRCGWNVLLEATLRSPRAHVLILTSRGEAQGVDGFPIDCVLPAALVAAVRPRALDAGLERRVVRAAAHADGWPGRFARLLWSGRERTAETAEGAGRPCVAAESQAVYGIRSVEEANAESRRRLLWPATGETAPLRRRLDQAERLLAEARRAEGERTLRRAIGSLARRDDWIYAGRGALQLSAFLRNRGRAQDALAALEQARAYWARAGDTAALIDVATLSGAALTDLVSLDEADSVLGAALAAARAHGDERRAGAAGLALARVRFWRGQYAQGGALLASVEPDRPASEESIRWQIEASRAAVGLRDASRAVSGAAAALDRAKVLGHPALVSDAACGLAFAHLAVGDLNAVNLDIALGVAAARAARDPLRGARCRLLLAERWRRGGQRSIAARLLARFRRVALARFPPILRARWAFFHDLTVRTRSASECVDHHATTTGLKALELFAPGSRAAPTEAIALADHMVELIEICQRAEGEATLLSAVCRHLRRQLRAAAVAFIGLDGSTLVSLAGDGSRVEAGAAERPIASGMPLPPRRVVDRLEAAVPVRYGGTTLGAIVARWTLGTAEESPGLGGLTLAATAAAPAVAAALDRRRRGAVVGVDGLIGVSAAMAGVREAVERAAGVPFAVLVEGESGSGKELVARALHRCGARRDRRFCSVNCAALPDDLIESELFGHARGAFTGATTERPGVFEDAHGGTLFLDEIADLSARAQAKLLRVVQDGELRRVGENVSRRVDVRVVSATNRDLRDDVSGGRFRLDLLYRLDVIRIVVPPLRERRDDVPILAEHFWREAALRVGSRASLASGTMSALARYDWPGNVRELQNVIAALAVRAARRGVVSPAALPSQFGDAARDDACRLNEARRAFEERFVRAALVRTGGCRTQAAAELGVTRQGLTKLMARLGIDS